MKAVKITADSIPHILKVTQRYTEDVLNCFAFDADLCPCEYYYIAIFAGALVELTERNRNDSELLDC